ncbi:MULTISPECIES: hypothetical protein [Roseomonas]|uniref:hypothetical protein n=1 Tax=Roseomonas TaxID=125216 RepID=UPI0028CCADC4|nr:hypothetical protein [Roseomonas mucosa]MDT8312730.1 hypothetical protein [Roseomonas mucosa]MDT8351182.1 hypothetical protein [Roseomonas mucosa]MDT8360117.1 hypothetical protein [Roseomonas mucosa]
MLLQQEVGDECFAWLAKAGVATRHPGVARRVRQYREAGGPEPVLAFPPEASDEEHEALAAGFAERRAGWRGARSVAQADWLARHVLDPYSPDLLVTEEFAWATRARLLAKLRDEVRRERGFRTIRIDAETAGWLDALARHNGLGSRSEVVEMMVRVVTEAFGSKAPSKD